MLVICMRLIIKKTKILMDTLTKILNHGSPESSLSYSNYKFIPNKEEI